MTKQHPAPSEVALARVREEMSVPVDGAQYYALTLLSPDGESIAYDVMTHWVDFAYVDGRCHEVRKASTSIRSRPATCIGRSAATS